MTQTVIAMRAAGVVLLVALMPAPSQAAGYRLGQMCWSHGAADNRVYYAENYVEADRSESFDALMEFTGIYRMPTSCLIEAAGVFEAKRERLFREWAEEGLEAVNTTFLSDLDY